MTNVYSVADFVEQVEDLPEQVDGDPEDWVVLVGGFGKDYGVSSPDDPKTENEQFTIGTSGFAGDAFADDANLVADWGRGELKSWFLHTLVVPREVVSDGVEDLIDGTDAIEDDADEVATDGGVAFTDLHAFKRDLLFAVRDLERDDPPKGTALKAALEADYDGDINHSRLYQNLDDLVNLGLVEKGRKDDRTNEYATTAEGRRLLESHAAHRAETAGLDVDAPRPSAVVEGGDGR